MIRSTARFQLLLFSFLCSGIFLLFSAFAAHQVSDTGTIIKAGKGKDSSYIYLDEYKCVTKDNVNYSYVSVMVYVREKKSYENYFYDKDRKLLSYGEYLDKYKRERSGQFIEFYPSGKKYKTKEYVKNELVGFTTFWYPDGQMMKQEKWVENVDLLVNAWDPAGTKLVSDGFGYYKEYYDDTLVLFSEGNYAEGICDGEWKYYFKDGNIKNIETWKNGKLIKGIAYTPDGEKEYSKVYETAVYLYGEAALSNHIRSTIKYPPSARENGIQGKVFVEFTVVEDGSIKDIKVIRSIHPLLDKEAIRVVKAMSKWTPGKERGFIKDSKFVLPINFRLG